MGPVVGVVDDLADFLIDLEGDRVTVVALLADLAAKEDHLVLLAVGQRAEAAHPELGDHPPGDARRPFDVVRGAGRDFLEDEVFGHLPGHEDGDIVPELGLGLEHPVLVGHGPGVASGHPAGHDRHFAHRVRVRQHARNQGVTSFVIGGHQALAFGNDPALALGTGDHAIDRFGQFSPANALLVAAGGEDRGLVDRVLEIGPGETRGEAGERFDRDVLLHRLAAGVDIEDRAATLDVGAVEHHLAIEPARPKQGGIEHIGPVGGGNHDHVDAAVEPVHLDQELVEGLLALVVAAAEAGAALAADGIDLVDEDDAGRTLLGLLEEITDAAGPDADEHFDELGAGDAEERHASLPRHGAGKQRLAGAGRADEQHAAWDAGAEGREFLGVLQELDDFGKFFLGLIDPGDIGEGDRGPVAGKEPGPALAERHRLAVRALALAHEEDDQANDQHQRQQEGEDADDGAPAAGGLDLDRHGAGGDASGVEDLDDVAARRDPGLRIVPRGIGVLDPDAGAALLGDQPFDLATLDVGDDRAVEVHALRVVAVAGVGEPEHANNHQQQNPDKAATQPLPIGHAGVLRNSRG